MSENIFLPSVKQNTSVAAEQKKQEVTSLIQSAMIIAKKFPRNNIDSFNQIIESCKRATLAQQACYAYPRGGTVVTGPSIRLAEVVASAWGNIKYGFNELEQLDGHSVVEAFCHDLQSNTLVVRTFTVPHIIDTKQGGRKTNSSREIYELVANYAQRRVRAAILEVIPSDVVEAAVNEVKKTLSKGNGEPIIDRIRKLVIAFKDIGVNQEAIEKKLGHKIELTTSDEIVELVSVFNSIKDKQASRSDFFEGFKDEADESKAKQFKDKLASISEEPKKEENKEEEKPKEEIKKSVINVAENYQKINTLMSKFEAKGYHKNKFKDFMRTSVGHDDYKIMTTPDFYTLENDINNLQQGNT